MLPEPDHRPCRQTFIIGGGVFGLSLARQLLKDPSNYVTICDNSDCLAPSRDVSKILRIDYPTTQRMKDVIRSKHSWENDRVFQPFFYGTGRVVAYSPASIDTLNGIDHARSELGFPVRKRQSTTLLKDIFSAADAQKDLSVVNNNDDGVLDWTGAIESVRQDCVNRGARFRNDTVFCMEADESGRVQVIKTSKGCIDTSHGDVILATGAWIMPMLEASSIELPSPSRSPIATGIFSFTLELSLDQWNKYRSLPAFSEIGVGEFLCHPTKIRSAKLTWITPFCNPRGPKAISRPWDASNTDLALDSMLNARSWIRQAIPGLKGARIAAIHSWWDGVTDDQDPIIARHPAHPNLVVAGGASYTHAKDVPEIGLAIVDALNGKETASFGWTKSPLLKGSENQPALRSSHNFEDLEGRASKSSHIQQWRESGSEYVI